MATDLATIRIPVDSSDMVRAVKDARGLENSIKLLEKSFGAGNIGSQQFSKGLLQLKRQYEGLFGSSQKATAEVQRYARSLQEVRASQAALEGHVNQASKGMNKFGVAAQQTGYQVSDFIVQVQSGANPLVAFSQQATQLAGLLYLLPPATQAARIGMLGFSVSLATATAGLTIIIPLFAMLAMSFFSSNKASKEADESLKGYEGTLGKLSSKLSEVTFNIEAMKRGLKPDEILEAKLAIEALRAEFIMLTTTAAGAAAASADPWGLSNRLAEIRILRTELEATLKDLEAQKKALENLAAAEEASRVQNLYKLQLLDEQQVRLENGRKLVRELLSTYTDIGGAVKAISEIDLKAVFEDAVEPSSALYQFVANTFDTMVKMTDAAAAAQRTEYYKLETLNEGAMGRAGAAGQGLAESYSFVEKEAKKLTGTTKELKKELTAAEKASKEFADTMDGYVVSAVGSVSDAFGDFVMRGFKDFKGFVNSILGSFTNMLAQMIALAARNKIMVSMGLGGAGSIAGGVANAATGGMGGLGGIATGIGGIGGTIGGGLMAGAGLAINGGMAGIVGGVTGGLSAFTSGIGAIGSVAGAGTAALGGLATAIGAIALPIAAVVAVFSFFKKKTKELDSGLRITVNNMDTLVETFKKTETKRFWGLSRKTSSSTGAASSEVADPIENAVSAIQNSIVDMAGALSIGSEAFDNFYFQLKVSLKGLSAEEATAKIQEELMKVGDAMAEMIPDLAALAQGSETASETLVRLYTSLQAANAYFGPLIDTLFEASLAGADLASTMVQAFGSLDAFNSNMAYFAQNFYTQAEQVAWASDRVNKAFTDLGMTAPATADAFRILVEDLMKATTSGVEGAAEQLAAVLAVQQDMLAVSVYEAEQAAEAQRLAIQLGEEARRLQEQLDRDTLRAAEEAAREAQAIAEEAAKNALRTAEEKAALEIQLLEAQGKATEALKLQREAELAALDETNRAILQQIFDLQDLTAAQQLANEAAQEATRIAEEAAREAQAIAEEAAQEVIRIAKERSGLDIQLLEAQGNAVEALKLQREAELAALDETNRAILQQIFDLQDLNAAQQLANEAAQEATRIAEEAAQEATRIAEEAAQEATRIAEERSSLEIRLLEAQGKATEALTLQREAEIAALSATSGAILQQIFDLQDLAAAASAASAVAKEYSSLEIRLLEAQGNSAGALKLQREAEIAALDESNKAILQQIFDLEDLNAAQELAAQAAQARQEAAQRAAEEAAQKAEKIAQERYDLESQLLELQGNTVELRNRELALLDPTNRALQEMVWKLEEAKDALEAINEIDFATKVDYLRAVGVARGGIAGFAAGGMHSGGARIVGESGPELEVTGPSRIYSKQDTSNMFRDPDLASAVQGLRNEVSGMRSEQLQLQVEISKNTKRVYDVERKWDIDGLPPVRV